MKTNTIEFRVELEDTDIEGIVFYPKYFFWFDRATNAFLKSVGLNHSQLLSQYHYAQPITECKCQFTHPLRYDDPVRVTTSVSEVHEHFFKLQHVIYSDELLIASGYEVRAWVKIDQPDTDKRFVVIPIPAEMAAKLIEHTKEIEPGRFSEYENISG